MARFELHTEISTNWSIKYEVSCCNTTGGQCNGLCDIDCEVATKAVHQDGGLEDKSRAANFAMDSDEGQQIAL